MNGIGDEPRLRLLVDSCLTPASIVRLRESFGDAVDAVHVDSILPPGTPDDAIVERAWKENRAVVTSNAADFLALIRGRTGHSGLVLVDDQNSRERQIGAVERIVRATLDHLTAGGGVDGHVFTWRRTTSRLAVRRLP